MLIIFCRFPGMPHAFHRFKSMKTSKEFRKYRVGAKRVDGTKKPELECLIDNKTPPNFNAFSIVINAMSHSLS